MVCIYNITNLSRLKPLKVGKIVNTYHSRWKYFQYAYFTLGVILQYFPFRSWCCQRINRNWRFIRRAMGTQRNCLKNERPIIGKYLFWSKSRKSTEMSFGKKKDTRACCEFTNPSDSYFVWISQNTCTVCVCLGYMRGLWHVKKIFYIAAVLELGAQHMFLFTLQLQEVFILMTVTDDQTSILSQESQGASSR